MAHGAVAHDDRIDDCAVERELILAQYPDFRGRTTVSGLSAPVRRFMKVISRAVRSAGAIALPGVKLVDTSSTNLAPACAGHVAD